jgi:hypothetical protein
MGRRAWCTRERARKPRGVATRIEGSRWFLSRRAMRRWGGSPSRMFSRCSCEMVFDARTGPERLETGRWIMSEDISHRKMLSLLGFGAALGFTLSGVLEPLEAEAQEAAPATPPAAAPASATGTRGRNRRTSRRATRHQRRSARHGHPAAPATAPAAPTQ